MSFSSNSSSTGTETISVLPGRGGLFGAGDPTAGTQVTWRMVWHSLRRPYPVTVPLLLLFALLPLYLVIANRASAAGASAPAFRLDGLIPLVPGSALIYGALYGFLILVPVFVIQDEDLIRRTIWAYLSVWASAYVVFLLYPTVAPRPSSVTGDGFGVWGLRFLYDADPPFNCFPSLHVAHSFVSAFACSRVHRRLGQVATVFASLVAVSTLFTKQHYVVDLIAGVLLALAAYRLFLRSYSPERTPEPHRRVAPGLAWCAAGAISLATVCCWVAFRVGVQL